MKSRLSFCYFYMISMQNLHDFYVIFTYFCFFWRFRNNEQKNLLPAHEQYVKAIPHECERCCLTFGSSCNHRNLPVGQAMQRSNLFLSVSLLSNNQCENFPVSWDKILAIKKRELHHNPPVEVLAYLRRKIKWTKPTLSMNAFRFIFCGLLFWNWLDFYMQEKTNAFPLIFNNPYYII